MVEFALCLILFLNFVYGLIGLSMWGTAGVLAQEVAHETARKYAVTLDKTSAEKIGNSYLGRWGYLFISGKTIRLWDDDTTAYSEVIVKPRLTSLCGFTMPSITRRSEATLEDVFRNPDNYDR